MARGDGIHRTSARNMRLTTPKLKNAQQHNEREKESYVNQDIVPERSHLNVHFKKPDGGYLEQFGQMEADGIISTRGIKEDAFRYGELIFDVNSAYFFNHGGYDFAKQFYHDAYQAAIKIAVSYTHLPLRRQNATGKWMIWRKCTAECSAWLTRAICTRSP